VPFAIDLAARIDATPPDAAIRARYLMLLEEPLRALGHDPALVRPARPCPAYTMVPVREYLAFAHAAGAAVGPTPEQGIAQLHQDAMSALIEVPASRLFLSPRDLDPFKLLGRFASSRSLVASYGEWSIEGQPGDATITVRKEWVWIEAMWASVLRSVFSACGQPLPVLECHLEDPWSGTLRFRW